MPLSWIPVLTVFALLQTLAPTPAGAREVATDEKRRLLWRKLEVQVQETARQLDGVPGVAIQDLTSGEKILVNPDELFPQASTIKIAVLADLYHQDQQAAAGANSKARLTDFYLVRAEDVVPESDILGGMTPGLTKLTNRDLATMMIAVSDNGATNVLIGRLGLESVNAFLDGLGLRATRLKRRMMDLQAAAEGRENVSTPREMASLFETIWAGKAFDKERTADFWKVLSTPKSSAMRRGLPDDAVAANKTGSLEGVRNDCGVVFAPNRPFVLCVMETYLKDEKAGEDAITRISAAAWSYFERVGRASPLGRVISTR